MAKIAGRLDVACGLSERRDGGLEQVSSGLPLAFERDYLAAAWVDDPWVPISASWKINRCESSEVLLPHDTLYRTAFYNDLLRPNGLRELVGGWVHKSDDAWVSFWAMPPADRRNVTKVVGGAIDRLMPHVSRAAHITRRLALAETLGDSLHDRFDRAGIGVFVFDRTRRLVCHNRLADELLRSGTFLRRAGATITTTRTRDASLLRATIDAALGKRIQKTPRAFQLSGREGSPSPLVIAAIPLASRSSAHFLARGPAALLLASVPTRRWNHASVDDALAAAYGLTPAEARVAAIVGSGLAPRAAAEELGITVGTARFQLKRVYAKLDVEGQRGLVSVVSALQHFAGLSSQ